MLNQDTIRRVTSPQQTPETIWVASFDIGKKTSVGIFKNSL